MQSISRSRGTSLSKRPISEEKLRKEVLEVLRDWDDALRQSPLLLRYLMLKSSAPFRKSHGINKSLNDLRDHLWMIHPTYQALWGLYNWGKEMKGRLQVKFSDILISRSYPLSVKSVASWLKWMYPRFRRLVYCGNGAAILLMITAGLAAYATVTGISHDLHHNPVGKEVLSWLNQLSLASANTAFLVSRLVAIPGLLSLPFLLWLFTKIDSRPTRTSSFD